MFSNYFASSFGSRLHHLVATPFPPIVFLKLSRLSTSTAGNDRPTGYPEAEKTCPISVFLLNECGLRQPELSTIFRIRPSLIGARFTHTAQQAVQFLRDSGFTQDQVRKLITRNPSILTLHADRQLKPKFEFMKTLGFTAQDVGKAIYQQPRMLSCSLEKTVLPNIRYLQNLFGSEADGLKVFKRVPQIIASNNMPQVLEKKMKHLASFGLLEDEIKELASRCPYIRKVSMDKVQKIMDFFMHTVGFPAKFIISYPKILMCSLKCNIKPRHNVIKCLSAIQPSKRLLSLTNAVYLSERQFLERYVECSPHATKLLEIYKGKPAVLDIIQ